MQNNNNNNKTNNAQQNQPQQAQKSQFAPSQGQGAINQSPQPQQPQSQQGGNPAKESNQHKNDYGKFNDPKKQNPSQNFSGNQNNHGPSLGSQNNQPTHKPAVQDPKPVGQPNHYETGPKSQHPDLQKQPGFLDDVEDDNNYRIDNKEKLGYEKEYGPVKPSTANAGPTQKNNDPALGKSVHESNDPNYQKPSPLETYETAGRSRQPDDDKKNPNNVRK